MPMNPHLPKPTKEKAKVRRAKVSKAKAKIRPAKVREKDQKAPAKTRPRAVGVARSAWNEPTFDAIP